MPPIVDGIDLERRYHYEDIIKWYKEGKLRAVGLRGYVVRGDSDGMIGFVPASESTLFRMPGHNTDTGKWEPNRMKHHVFPNLQEEMAKDVEAQHPMLRRTVQQKKASLVRRLLETAKMYGTIPGLTDEQISAMIGETWKTGVSVVTAEMLDRVSANLLGVGEVENKKAEEKRVTKAHPYA